MNRLAAERVSRLRGHINNGLSQSDSESKISLSRVLDTEGKVVAGMPEFAHDPAILLRLYRFLVLTRIFDTKACCTSAYWASRNLSVIIRPGSGCRRCRGGDGAG